MANLKERNNSGEKMKTLNENHSRISQSTFNKEKTRYNNKTSSNKNQTNQKNQYFMGISTKIYKKN
jgi:hypothetical protein